MFSKKCLKDLIITFALNCACLKSLNENKLEFYKSQTRLQVVVLAYKFTDVSNYFMGPEMSPHT